MQWYVFVLLFRVCVIQCHSISVSEIEDFNNFLKETSRLDQNVKSVSPDDYDEDELISDHAWEESGKFEGDLILNDRQRRLIVADVAEGLARNGLTDTTKRWPNNEVVYFIQREHFTGDQVQAIQDGIDDLARASCVKFSPYRKGDRDAVVIQGSRRGCFSQVGYQGGYQVLNLSGRHPVGRGCFRHGTVVHELLHTLGFYHMQSSPDRDEYIEVAWENIIKPARHNFRKYNSFAVSDFGVGYDYESVLHYSRKAFSANGQDTLIPKQGGADIGQRIGLSQKDIQKLNKMYCDGDSDIADENDNNAKKPAPKKKAKNKPFQGHGIGYQQGKTVVIKLPTAEVYKLQDSPQTQLFDYFSSTKKTVPSTAFEGLGAGKEVNYDFVSPTNLAQRNNMKSIPITIERPEEQYFSRESPAIKYNQMKHLSDEDDDLKEAFYRFSKIIEPQTYPGNLPIYKYEASDKEKLKEDDGFKDAYYKVSENVNPQPKLLTNEYFKPPQNEKIKAKEINHDELIYPRYQLIHKTEPSSVNKHNQNVNTEISRYISPFLAKQSNNEHDTSEKVENESPYIKIGNSQMYPEILPINHESRVNDELKEDDDLKEAFFRLSQIIKPQTQSNLHYYKSSIGEKLTEEQFNPEEIIYPRYQLPGQLKTVDQQNINENIPSYNSPSLVKQNKNGRKSEDKVQNIKEIHSSDTLTEVLPEYYYKDYNDPNGGEQKQIIFDPQDTGDKSHENVYYDDTSLEYQQDRQLDAHQHNQSQVQNIPFNEHWVSNNVPVTHRIYQSDQSNHEYLFKNPKLTENYR